GGGFGRGVGRDRIRGTDYPASGAHSGGGSASRGVAGSRLGRRGVSHLGGRGIAGFGAARGTPVGCDDRADRRAGFPVPAWSSSLQLFGRQLMHLQARGVACHIAGRAIVSDIDLDVPRGSMLGLVGVNGSGKSTLIRALAGLRDPAAGTVAVDGVDMASMSARQRATKLAYVGQEESPPEDLLLDEMVAMGRIPHRPPWALGGASEHELSLNALTAVGLKHAAKRRCDQLSGGERRRAMLARALAQGCDLLILDEPTNHLDIHHQLHLLETVRGLGQTVIAAMHDLALATAFFDRI